MPNPNGTVSVVDQLAELVIAKVDGVATDVKSLQKELEEVRISLARRESDAEKIGSLQTRLAVAERTVADLEKTLARWSGMILVLSGGLSVTITLLGRYVANG